LLRYNSKICYIHGHICQCNKEHGEWCSTLDCTDRISHFRQGIVGIGVSDVRPVKKSSPVCGYNKDITYQMTLYIPVTNAFRPMSLPSQKDDQVKLSGISYPARTTNPGTPARLKSPETAMMNNTNNLKKPSAKMLHAL
jgi:hypothetical protein